MICRARCRKNGNSAFEGKDPSTIHGVGPKISQKQCKGPAQGFFEDADPHIAGWSSPVAREAHNLEVAGSNPVPAT